MSIFCCNKNSCCKQRQIINRNNYITGPTGPTGATGPIGATGPTGPTGATGISTLIVSLNRNDTDQTVANDEVVSISGTNFISQSSDLSFNNDIITINASGIYQVTGTLEVTTENDTFDFTITAGGTDYSFYVYVADGKVSGTTTYSVLLNVINTPLNIAIYNRNGDDVDIAHAELDVIKITNWF